MLVLPMELVNIIIGNYEELVTREKKDIVMRQLVSASSRKNGFLGQCDEDTECDHWVFWAGGIENQFQAVNCSACGGYDAYYLSYSLPYRLKCMCWLQQH